MRLLPLAALLLAPLAARASTISGGDWGGLPLTPANGDTLSGVFTNVSVFTVGTGTTAYVAPGTPLVIYAGTVVIRGVIDGVGRGQPGGNGGPEAGVGLAGFGDGPGFGGGAANSGGGGSHGGLGGAGAGPLRGSTSPAYGAAAAFTVPISSDDAAMGSGGGGGGGAPVGYGSGGAGGAGGGAVYIEAASMTVTGSILLTGATAATVAGAISSGGDVPAGGGGGAGGALVLRITKALSLESAILNASAGYGSRIADGLECRGASPGGGGGGGRVKIYARTGTALSVTISTGPGFPGASDCAVFDSPKASTGLAGTASFGRVAASASAFAASGVYVSSVAWTWTASPDLGDGAGPVYRVFPATATAPLTAPEFTTAGLQLSATVQNLVPNTTYYRAVTAYTGWGDSALSAGATAFTLAADPAAAGFSAITASGLTASWTSGSPANPSYTLYRVQSSTDSAFGGGGTTDAVALSTSPTGLTPNTTHYFRVRAINVAGQPTAFTASFATATLAAAPSAAVFAGVHISSVSFGWSGAGNPTGTVYQAEVSSDAFATIAASSLTLNTVSTFTALNTGTVFAFRVRAVNRNSVPTSYTTAISTAAGLLSDTSPPTAPGRPTPDRLFSYDGNVFYTWTAAGSSVGILKYKFFLGTRPGADDVISNADSFVSSYSVSGLATGRTYYALVLPVSNAGVNGFSSESSAGTAVFLPEQEKAIVKPYNWPNPFDPAQGATQIGVFLDEAAEVSLKIYDLRGGLVHASSRRFDAAGNQILTWDGRDGRGALVAPGGYIGVVRKVYGSRSDTQKLKIAVLY